MPGRGRPTKLTPELQESLLQAIRGGNFREVAAQWVGIDPATLSRWMARGVTRPGSVYGTFRQAVIEAEQRAEIGAVALVMSAARKNPDHAKWWLERKFPQRWGRHDRLDVGQAGPTVVRILVDGTNDAGSDAAPAPDAGRGLPE